MAAFIEALQKPVDAIIANHRTFCSDVLGVRPGDMAVVANGRVSC